VLAFVSCDLLSLVQTLEPTEFKINLEPRPNKLNQTDRLIAVQTELRLSNREMAAELRVSEHWYSKLVNRHRTPSEDLVLRLDEMLRRRNLSGSKFELTHLKTGGLASRVAETVAPYSGAVASRLPQKREPSTRADCEGYFSQLMDAADLSDDPNAWPVILHRLKKQFPLDEWSSPPSEEGKP